MFNAHGPRQSLLDAKVTYVLSAIRYSFDGWGEEAAAAYQHLSIDIDDHEDEDLLVHLPAAARFMDECLYPPSRQGVDTDTVDASGPASPGVVYVHCAMGRSRSVTCVIAYLLYKYPHRFGGRQASPDPSLAERQRRAEEAPAIVAKALELVQEARSIAQPNDGFMRQLELWWEMGCPVSPGALENHPVYQKWLYQRVLKEARDARMAPDAQNIRFEDEAEADTETQGTTMDEETGGREATKGGKEVRCKKCRRVLATPRFRVPHAPTGEGAASPQTRKPPDCAHIFVETLSWMRPALEGGELEGRLVCPAPRCGASVGRFAWQGLRCTCGEWVVPAFSLARGRVDEVIPRDAPGGGGGSGGPGGVAAIRMPPGRNGSL